MKKETIKDSVADARILSVYLPTGEVRQYPSDLFYWNIDYANSYSKLEVICREKHQDTGNPISRTTYCNATFEVTEQ